MKKFCGRMAAILCCITCYAAPVMAEIQTVYQLDYETASTTSATGAKTRTVDGKYHLDAGDKIKVVVFGEPDMTVEIRLGSSGDMRYPFLGKMHVAGMTLPELQKKITRELSNGFLVDPQVRVSMQEFRPFYVNGEVKMPGGYPYQPGLTVRKAISLAGGFSQDADKEKVFLIKAGDIDRQEYKISLHSIMAPGDIITIKQSFFFVNGEVKKPGRYPYKPGLTVRKAISLAGGFTENADKKKVFLIAARDTDRQEYKISLYSRMAAGDIITIRQSFFFVNGEVGKPGRYPYQEGMTYRMAISMAGGLKEKSDDDKVYVIHEGRERQNYHVGNLDTLIRPGDVITAKEGFF